MELVITMTIFVHVGLHRHRPLPGSLGLALARRAAERGARPWIGVRALRGWLHRGRRPVEPPGNLAGGVVKYLTMAHIHPRPGTDRGD